MEKQQKHDPLKETFLLYEKHKETFDKITNELIKYDEIIGLVILPPLPEKEYRDKINLVAIIDNINVKGEKLPKIEYLEKLITETIESNKNFFVKVILLNKIWDELNSQQHETYYPIMYSKILFDKKFVLEAMKIGLFLRNFIIEQQYDKLILSIFLFGSVARADTKPRDIDIGFIIDDTSLDENSKTAIVEQTYFNLMKVIEHAKEILKIESDKEIHIQTLLLSKFWEHLKGADPILVNYLRQGVVFYDKGIFLVWKRLLNKGEIKPTSEAIDTYFRGIDFLEKDVFNKFKNIVMEDIFWPTIYSTQAVLMALGYIPPYPKTLPSFIKTINEKENIFEEEDILFLEKILKYRKELEHGEITEIEGKEIDELLKNAIDYFKKMKKKYRKIILNYREKEIYDLLKENKKLLEMIYDIDDFSFLNVLIEKGLITKKIEEFLPYFKKLEKKELEEKDIEYVWKGLKTLNFDLKEKYGEILDKKINKLICKGIYNNEEVTIFFVENGFYITYSNGKAIKIYYDGKTEESTLDKAFKETMETAEKLKTIKINPTLLGELGITLEF